MTDQPINHGRASRPIALQLWTIRDELANDPDQALARVKAAGFAAVEVAPLPEGLTPEWLGECLKRHGLSVVSIHGDLPTLENLASWKQITHACHCSKILWHGWPRDPRFDSAAGLQDLIAACNQAGAIARDHGLQLGLHNHWWEFEPIEGAPPIDRIDEDLDSDIFWQLDVYWAQTAGVDPAGVVRKLGSRISSIHWKDGPAVHGEPMVALGQGSVDVSGILQALDHPVDWVIELDECATDPLEAARESRIFLESR